MVLFLRYKNRKLIAKVAGFYLKVFSLVFSRNCTVNLRYHPTLVFIIFDNIIQDYIISLWLFLWINFKEKFKRAHGF